jgi:hypothetical protein
MPSGQTGPQPMTMPFGGGFNSPFGGFGGMPMFGPAQQYQQPIQSQIPMGTDPAGGPNAAGPQKNYGAVPGMLNTAQQQVQQPTQQAPMIPMNGQGWQGGSGPMGPTGMGVLGSDGGSTFYPGGSPSQFTNTPFGQGAMGTGRGKGRTGPGTSGGFSGGCGVTPRGMM